MTEVAPAPEPQQQQQPEPQPLPPSKTPDQPLDDSVQVDLTAPKTITLEQFLDGFVVEAECKDEECLRRFREHAAINTGATRIAGLQPDRVACAAVAQDEAHEGAAAPMPERVEERPPAPALRAQPDQAAKKAAPFRLKVVVSAVDAAGNKDYAKAFVTVKP